MAARRIAREIAVILMPQLPKTKEGLEALDMNSLIEKTVKMMADYAKQSLLDAGALLEKSSHELTDIEAEHDDNKMSTQMLKPVKFTTAQLREQLGVVERAINLVNEALEVPEMTMATPVGSVTVACKMCGHSNRATFEKYSHDETREFLMKLLGVYMDHREEVDKYLMSTRAKWNVDRMVTIDRDILRLACAEAFFLHEVPVNVAISEAVELCHRFADERAARFVNGVIADLAEQAKEFRRTGLVPELSEQEEESENLEQSKRY